MSGFEIAGVVLGSLPLIISALENYTEIVDTYKRARKYKTEIKRIKHDLDAESSIFLDTLEHLVDGLVPPKQFEELLKDPLCELWKNEVLNKRLQERLGRSYSVYTDSVNEMNATVQQFVERLDLNEEGKVRWIENTGLGLVSKRAGFSLQKRAFDDLVERLQKHNRHLEKLVNRSVEFEPSRKKRKQSSRLQKLGQYAKCVFHALEASFGCNCKGVDSHTALLGISSQSTTEVTDTNETTKVQVVVSGRNSEASGNQRETLTWQELSLHAVEAGSKGGNAGQVEQKCAMLVKSPLVVPTKPAVPKSKRVRFFQSSPPTQAAAPAWSQRTSTQTTTTTPAPPNTVLLQSPSPPLPISELCEIIRTRPSTFPTNPGYILDSDQKVLLHQIAHSSSSDKDCWTAMPLQQILEGSTGFPPLTPWNRITLSATLASAVLQLYGSPWLGSTWDNKNVFFLKRSDQRPYKEAFLAKKMLDSGKTAVRPTQNFIFNDTLLALAVALIELSLGPFRNLQTQEDLNAGNIADLVTASRLVAENKILEEYGPRYQAAVERCIELAKTHKTWTEDVHQELYEGVVSVLEDQAMRQNSAP
ncbi:hypothetical protein DE146DRAFT_420818 [Phaeosphaeria sp. MPI-PUGE-AT-0046c]|nr:hypothetical protein DE146DRAFT_420818 [Phaeosphaeria sp. MPI-PUGE-AT-0046c]